MMKDLALKGQLFLRTPLLSYRDFDLSNMDLFLQDPYFREAIALSSPAFYHALAAREFSEASLSARERFTLAKYFNRACFRPTPFGSFSSFSVIRKGRGETIRLAPLPDSRLHLYPDLALSHMRFQSIRRYEPAAKLALNPSLYRLGKCLRYYAASVGPKGRFRFTIEESEAHRFNLALYRLLHGKTMSGTVLESWVMEKAQCDRQAAAEYIFLLLQEQFLYNADQGNMILGSDADREGRTVVPGSTVRQNPPPLVNEPVTWYAALERPATGTFSAEEERQLLEAVKLMHRLSANEPPQALTEFIRNFELRFDQQRVPLLLALDPDTGLTYGDRLPLAAGGGLLGEVHFPLQKTAGTSIHLSSSLQLLMQQWLNHQDRHPRDPIIITEDSLATIPQPRFSMPGSTSVMFRKAGGRLLIEHTGGVSATQLIGRFSLFSDEVHGIAQQLAKEEQAAHPDVYFADINILSDIHADNINRRHQIYDHQINVNAFSPHTTANDIQLSDLELSVSRGELILTSRKLGKRVIPRLATAHNYKHNELPLIRLLGDLQYQGISTALDVDLPRAMPGLRFYPRIIYQQVVLATACWRFRSDEMSFLNIEDPAAMFRALQLFRSEHGLPERVTFGHHDQLMVFNLAAADEAVFFCRCLQGTHEIWLREYLPADHTVMTATGRPMAGQFVAALSHTQPVYRPAAKPIHRKAPAIRAFRPGSDWLYVKFYCSVPAADELLLSLIAPLVKSYEHRLRCWFFIRYQDPEQHIRLRMRGDENTIGTLLIAIEQALTRSELTAKIGKVQYETYQRELERYGANYIGPVETIFQAGSALMLALLSGNGTEATLFSRIFELILQMSRIFFKQDPELLQFTTDMTDSYLAEFQADKKLLVALDLRYRELRPVVTSALSTAQTYPAAYGKQRRIFLHLLGQLEQAMIQETAGKRSAMVADLIHMQLNRMFSQEQRRQEMMVYFCLNKYLKSQKARGLPASV